MKVRLLQRYVFREMLSPFLVGLLVFTFVLTLRPIFDLIDLFLNRGVTLDVIFKMVGLFLPMFFPISIPMSLILAALVAYGRLSEEGEITALRSSGCPHTSYVWPNVAFGIILSLVLVHFNLNVAPRASREFRKMQMDVARKSPLALFVPKVMNHFGEYKIIVDKMDRVRSRLSGVSIYRMNAEGSPTRILAPEGIIRTFEDGDITIELRNGAVHQPDPEKNNQYTITKFNKFVLRVPSGGEGEAYVPTPREMTLSELLKKADDSKKEGQSPASLMTEIHQRVAVSFASAVFVVLGIVLGIQLKKGSKAVGIGMSLVVILAYYGILLLMASLSSRNAAASAVLTWVPNLAALLVAGFLWMRLARR